MQPGDRKWMAEAHLIDAEQEIRVEDGWAIGLVCQEKSGQA